MSRRTQPKPREWYAPSYLHRAIVSLPSELCERERPLQERLVFFEHHHLSGKCERLEALLFSAWNTDTTDWCERGYIYNISSAHEVLRGDYSFSDACTGNLQLLESGCGGDGDYAVGPDRIHYWRATDVDLFVTPVIAGRLRALLASVEALYAAEPARRRRAANASAEVAGAHP